jgi:hypothetical protein
VLHGPIVPFVGSGQAWLLRRCQASSCKLCAGLVGKPMHGLPGAVQDCLSSPDYQLDRAVDCSRYVRVGTSLVKHSECARSSGHNAASPQAMPCAAWHLIVLETRLSPYLVRMLAVTA